ncbi:hypothetical protein POV26_09620 [Aequorivita todarodis]|uniref:hypothetical protein n=1 Tax=Aequorivita todarodis TaxID=2036821 RepID=UPI002350D18A|nr:hypothetical protein [Aequorivita todarodis]MDC8001296.1 hypothetical protein [Aequorivita todarodis]
MKITDFIPLVDFTGGLVATIISIVVCFAIIGGLILYVKRSKKRKNMVHNRKKKNDNPARKS